ncbi:MAG: ABC transporter permease, partial [Mesorhizobium sp.]|nr:ABC transporter permease [Mesorhizobium sp.]
MSVDRMEPAITRAGVDAAGIAQVAPPALARRQRLSPLNRRRWQNFKANRRGYWSLWIFLALFVVT